MSQPMRETVVDFGSIALHVIVVVTYFCFGIITVALNMYVIGKGVMVTSAFNKSTKGVDDCIFGCNNSASYLYFSSVSLSNIGYGDIIPRDGGRVAMLLIGVLTLLDYYIANFMADVEVHGCVLGY